MTKLLEPFGLAGAVDRERLAARRRLRLEARRLLAAGLVAPGWYRRTYPETRGRGLTPAEDYLAHGARAGRDPHPEVRSQRTAALLGVNGDGINPLIAFLDRADAQDRLIGAALRGRVENLPGTVRVGLGTALFLQGWCYPTRGRIRFLDLVIGDRRHPITDHSHPRPDVLEAETARDPEARAFLSGFETVVEFAPVGQATDLECRLRVVTHEGDVMEQGVGTLSVRPDESPAPVAAAWRGGGARVAICMATYRPPLDLFAAQVASIKAQNHGNWVCVVSDDASPDAAVAGMQALLDDPRFLFSRSPVPLGFYRNFERALALCPADADFVALSDQDDRWHPDKLATLLDALDGEAQLAYADVRIVGRDGEVRSDTFWATRRNNFTSLPSLLAANTVMGAASLFRATLLRRILPFPERLGEAYHDHWIALNALVSGGIRYVARPLHDYVQHGQNVIGHKQDSDAPGLAAAARELLSALKRREHPRHVIRAVLARATQDRQSLVAQKVVLSRVLLLRHPGMRPHLRRSLERLSRIARVAPVARERVFAALERRPTLNHEGHFLRAVLLSRLAEASFTALGGRVSRRVRARRYAHALRRLSASQGSGREPLDFTPLPGRDIPAMRFGHIGWIFHNVSPLTLAVAPNAPRRVNLLLATIDFDLLFGGYIGMFNFALRLRRLGYRVRIVLLERTVMRQDEWRAKMARYQGLSTLFDDVEVEERSTRATPLDVHPDDRFVATSGWNAHVAHAAAQALGQDRFLFLVQEFEPFFGAMNTSTALLRQAYDLPQFALFSTAILRDYFRLNRIGVFAAEGGDERSAVFSNAILRLSPDRAALGRRSRRILFYARPEDHAARNLFEMGIAALVTLFADPPVVAEGWTAHGIGSIGAPDRLELAPGVFLQMVPKMSLEDYAAALPGFDVGLSLMLTPHPSLVPLEMAAAGLPTVTNTFANKTADVLAGISSNLIGVAPTLEGVVGGLRSAMARVDDVDARLEGARMTWPTDWDAAFPPDTIARICTVLGEPTHPGR